MAIAHGLERKIAANVASDRSSAVDAGCGRVLVERRHRKSSNPRTIRLCSVANHWAEVIAVEAASSIIGYARAIA
jgi:hypothetical protein